MIASILQKILDVVFTPCMEEDESYSHRTRKMASIAIAIIASPALFLGVPVTILSALYDPTTGAYIMGASMVSVVITSSITPYVYLRSTSKLPDWLVDFQIWSTVPTTFVISLFSNHSVVSILCSVTVFLGIIMRVRGWPLLIVYGLIANIMHALIIGYPEELPQLHKTFYSPQMLSIRILYLIGGNIMPLVAFCLGLHAIMLEFVQRADQADAAIKMCLDVAGKLRRYDTEAVGVILAANKGKVDENLLEAFTAIQHNLQDYRPHIPDYVIANSTTASSGDNTTSPDNDDNLDDDEGGIIMSDTFCSSTNIASPASPYQNQTSDFFSPDRSTRSLRKITSGDNLAGDDMPSITSNPRSALSPHLSTSAGSAYAHRQSGATFGGDKHTKHRQPFYGRATTVFVRFVSAPCGSDGTGNGFVQKGNVNAAMDVLSKCLQAASQHAKIHGGALQYMQGCGLMVSFNAASRVLSYEASACAFALNLKTSIDELGKWVVMQASIVTSHVLSFFAGNGGPLMLTVLGGFMQQHAAIHHYLGQTLGPASSCVVMNNSVLPAVEMVFEHRLLGGFTIHPLCNNSAPNETSSISQLIKARKASTGDSEWMYHVVTHPTDDPVSEVVRSALEGSEITDLTTIQPHCVDDVVLTKCVLDRLEMCVRQEGTFTASVVPTVLW